VARVAVAQLPNVQANANDGNFGRAEKQQLSIL
jgi:hypothetical protein